MSLKETLKKEIFEEIINALEGKMENTFAIYEAISHPGIDCCYDDIDELIDSDDYHTILKGKLDPEELYATAYVSGRDCPTLDEAIIIFKVDGDKKTVAINDYNGTTDYKNVNKKKAATIADETADWLTDELSGNGLYEEINELKQRIESDEDAE